MTNSSFSIKDQEVFEKVFLAVGSWGQANDSLQLRVGVVAIPAVLSAIAAIRAIQLQVVGRWNGLPR